MPPSDETGPKPSGKAARPSKKGPGAEHRRFDEEASLALADRLRLLQALGKIKLNAYAKSAGVDFGEITEASYKTRLSQWMADPMARMAKLGADNCQRLAAALSRDFPHLEDHLLIPLQNLIKHPLYHSIASRLGSTRARDTVDYAIRRLVALVT